MSAELQHPLHQAWTLEYLERLPDDGHRYEIIDGVLAVTPPSTPVHQDVIENLRDLLVSRIGASDRLHLSGGKVKVGVGVRMPSLGSQRYLIPDLCVVHGERPLLHYNPEQVRLVVEVTSPATRTRDRGDKLVLFEEAGIDGYWLVDLQAQRLTCYELADESYQVSWEMSGSQDGRGLLTGVRFADLLVER